VLVTYLHLIPDWGHGGVGRSSELLSWPCLDGGRACREAASKFLAIERASGRLLGVGMVMWRRSRESPPRRDGKDASELEALRKEEDVGLEVLELLVRRRRARYWGSREAPSEMAAGAGGDAGAVMAAIAGPVVGLVRGRCVGPLNRFTSLIGGREV
jgi:hypothetical protein